MRLPSISTVFALAAGLASAAPIRVVVISKVQRLSPIEPAPAWVQSIRWGHAAAPATDLSAQLKESFAKPFVPDDLMRPNWMDDKTWMGVKAAGRNRVDNVVPVIKYGKIEEEPFNATGRSRMRKGGCRGGMRVKAIQMGNRLRVILGLPPIESHSHGMMRKVRLSEATSQPGRYRHYHAHAHHHMHREPFTLRLSRALAALGPWEGRAVSFVLGCGLGAILRMVFVFGVLVVRSMRCQRQQQPVALEEDTVIFVADIKEPIVAEPLPAYAEKTDESPQGHNATN